MQRFYLLQIAFLSEHAAKAVALKCPNPQTRMKSGFFGISLLFPLDQYEAILIRNIRLSIMNKHITLSAFTDELAQVRTKKEEFLNQMDRIIP